jgi:hypothetical protein
VDTAQQPRPMRSKSAAYRQLMLQEQSRSSPIAVP